MRTVVYFVLVVSNFAKTAYADFVYAPVETTVYNEEERKIFPFNVQTRGNFRAFRKAGACEKYLLQRLSEEDGWSLVRSVGISIRPLSTSQSKADRAGRSNVPPEIPPSSKRFFISFQPSWRCEAI